MQSLKMKNENKDPGERAKLKVRRGSGATKATLFQPSEGFHPFMFHTPRALPILLWRNGLLRCPFMFHSRSHAAAEKFAKAIYTGTDRDRIVSTRTPDLGVSTARRRADRVS
jgi:hypothetical protein